MDKMTKIISYLPEMAFIAVTVRAVAVGAGIGDALALISLVGSMAYVKYLNRSKVDNLDELNKKIEDLATQMHSLQMDKALRRQANEPKAQAGPRKLF